MTAAERTVDSAEVMRLSSRCCPARPKTTHGPATLKNWPLFFHQQQASSYLTDSFEQSCRLLRVRPVNIQSVRQSAGWVSACPHDWLWLQNIHNRPLSFGQCPASLAGWQHEGGPPPLCYSHPRHLKGMGDNTWSSKLWFSGTHH